MLILELVGRLYWSSIWLKLWIGSE